jgi:hypothetical protein
VDENEQVKMERRRFAIGSKLKEHILDNVNLCAKLKQ